ncbi:MAG: M15 family metallopeptidase [Xanthomonadales bacterium]|nr:M15 family metallopeptidase [Xanthomonadales bacterium]
MSRRSARNGTGSGSSAGAGNPASALAGQRPAWLINGTMLQLLASAGAGRAQPWHWRLLDRRDGRELASWQRAPSLLALGQCVPRAAWPELSRWLHMPGTVRPDQGPLPWTLPAATLRAALRERARWLRQSLALPLPESESESESESDSESGAYRLPLCDEPPMLRQCGHDLAGRPLWLTAAAGRAWQAMRAAAAADGLALLPVSAYRSIDYQAGLVARKQARGLSTETILRYSALPGHSEHHLGTVIDLHAGNGPALEESFQKSDAFPWLQQHAGRFGFVLSYGRDNPWGIGYEPWHWRFLPAGAQL